MARRRAKASDPLAAARRRALARKVERDPHSWGLDREALALPANAEVETRGDGPRTLRARRRDAFDRLLACAPNSLAAVRRLQADLELAQARGGGVARYAERIDAGGAGEDPLAEARRRASERARRALALAGPASARLLVAFADSPAQPNDRREIVRQVSGERLADAQAAVVRAAADNLAGAYAALDRRRG